MADYYEFTNGQRIMGVDPMRLGFGYAILETEPVQLVDWGVRVCRRRASSCEEALCKMLTRFQPTALVSEDPRHARSLRAAALTGFIEEIAELFCDGSVPFRTYARADVRRAFAPLGAYTKEAIARALAQRFPEIEHRRPPKREIWQSEASNMSIFVALSFAVTHALLWRECEQAA